MDHANNWLIVLAFVLGLLLTFALMIRRVKREVPVGSSAAAASESETTTAKTPVAEADAADKKTDEDSGG
jgi:hypothetical protein